MSANRLPSKLYKYRSFNVDTLRLLGREEVFYANPETFNDPLDCRPTVEIDTDRTLLEKLCFRMLVAAGKDREAARKVIQNHRYMSTEWGDFNTDPEVEESYKQGIGIETKGLLDKEMALSGVLSLSARWNCPLMWSHYADEHRGICIEFDMDRNLCENIKPVVYKRPVSIKISELAQWKLHNSDSAHQSVVDKYFFSKSRPWSYEKEWRDLRPSGATAAPFHISAVYFGFRCEHIIQTTIVKLLTDPDSAIKFYEMYPKDDSRFQRRLANIGEIKANGVQSSALMDFYESIKELN